MSHFSLVLRLSAVLLIVLGCVAPVAAKGATYMTDFTRWRAAGGDFASWQLSGARLGSGGVLEFDPSGAQPGTDPYGPGGYNSHNFYNGGSFLVGEATSPVVPASFSFTQAIASWNADTPTGTWIEVQIRAQLGNQSTKWYSLGVWAADNSTVERHSVNQQADTDGTVSVDTFLLTNKKAAATSFQLKVRLFSADGMTSPVVHNVSVAYSTTPVKAGTLVAGNPANWGTRLSVPECSQMVYPDGGNVWCSPVSTSMVLAYWTGATGPCEPRVRAALAGVFDWMYDGYGNWPFNTAYAGAQGMEGYVARFTSFSEAEKWIAAGVPVIFSYSWNKDLTGAPIPSSPGHLAVLVGFDANGNPIVNDPAAATDGEVQRTYLRSELEPLWLGSSGGTVYLIYPPQHTVPDL